MEKKQQDIDFVKGILPEHYEVKESSKNGSIHCKSQIGIRKPPYEVPAGEFIGGRFTDKPRIINDAEDEGRWDYIVRHIKDHFGERFQEIDHNTCFCHVDFTIYLKS